MNRKDIQAWMNEFKNFKEIVLELLYPTVCVLCGGVSKEGVCAKCLSEYAPISHPRCMCCGKPIKNNEAEYCEDCKNHRKAFYQGRSLWLHKGKVKQSIYLFKYKNKRIYAQTYAKLLVKEYGRIIEQWQPDCIVPVPVHRHRRKSRGYNQAEVLANYIKVALEDKIPMNTKLVVRTTETAFQKNLDGVQRRKNMRGAFRVKCERTMPKTVLVIDDIYTTGATMDELSKSLLKAGVDKVVFLTISVGQGY